MRIEWTSFLLLVLAFATPSLRAETEPYFVDLSAAANRGLEDDGIANNGRGGWTDEGINDFSVFPPLTFGTSVWHGTPLRLLDPAKNNGRAVLMLAGAERARDLPRSTTVAVPKIARRFVYFIHCSAARPSIPAGNVVAKYTLTYADNSTATLNVNHGQQIQNWFVGQWWDNLAETRYPIYMGRNSQSARLNQWVGIWASQWPHPHPEKPIVSITYESTGADVPVIFATTLADGDYAAIRDAKDNRLLRPPEPPETFFDAKVDGERLATFAAMKAERVVQGIRRLEVILPNLLAVTIDPALGEVAAGPGEKIAAACQKPDNFTVASDEDEVFGRVGIHPARVFRHSQKTDVRDVGPFSATPIFWHTYYLQLTSPLKIGKTYTVSSRQIASDFRASMSLRFDPAEAVTPAIKVNQVGYSALATRRYAYLGWWAAEGGAVDYSACKKFEVIDEATGKRVYVGEVTPRSENDKLSGEQVSELDLSVIGSGKYHVVVPGLGRSHSFVIGGDSARELYFNAARAFLHARCGAELSQAVTDWPRPPCHQEVAESKLMVDALHPAREGETVRKFRGGHHDSSDAALFASQLQGTAEVMGIYALFSSVFQDKDLNLPESGHGVPDLLSEAAWALSGFAQLQQDDGAVPLGRANGGDWLRQASAADLLPFGLLRARSTSSNTFAAAAAQFSRLVRPFNPALADECLARAEKAYAWAKANQPGADNKDPFERHWKMIWGWAAAELFESTGKEEFNEDFRAIYLAREFKSQMLPGGRAMLYVWPYVMSRQPKVDAVIQERLRRSLLDVADMIVRSTQETAYRMGQGKGDGGWGGGVGGGWYGDLCLRAYALTRESKYLDTACLNADFQLGANPLGICFITGMGARPPQSPEVGASLRSGDGKTAAGISVFGPGGRSMAGQLKAIPPWRCFEDARTSSYWSGFSVNETLAPAASLYSGLWALQRAK